MSSNKAWLISWLHRFCLLCKNPLHPPSLTDSIKMEIEYRPRPSSLGWQKTNFAATPDKSRGKFARAYNPPTVFCTFFHAIHLQLLITLHSTKRRKHKNNNKNILPYRDTQLRCL